MPILFLAALALAGDIVVHAEIPVEVAVDGRPSVQVFTEATVRLPADHGDHAITLMINGRPTKVTVTVPEKGGDAEIIVGRTGVTTRETAPTEVADDAQIDVRIVGDEGVRLYLADGRLRLDPGDQHRMTLTRGQHPVEVRSSDGTVVYATGELDVRGTGPVVVHLSAGRAPEVIGNRTGAWRPAEH